MNWSYYISFLLLLISLKGIGQNETTLIAHATDNSILLRWAGNNETATRILMREGVNIERVTIKQNGKLLPNPIKTIINSTPIKAFEENHENWSDTTDNYVQIAWSLLYNNEDREVVAKDIKSKILQEQQDKKIAFGFLLLATDFSQKAAKNCGLFFEDKTAKQNEKYLYKIIPVNKALQSSFTVSSLKEGNNFIQLQQPNFERVNKKVSVLWDVTGANYSGYVIEKSTNNKDFNSINTTPIVPLNTNENPIVKFDDTLVEYENTYYYRVKGINSFALQSPPTKSIKVEVYKQLTQAPKITEFVPLEKEVSLSWDWNEKDKERANKLILKRAPKASGPYEVVANNLFNKTSFKDNKALPVNYYQLVAKNSYGDSVISMPILVQFEDNEPPAAPQIIKGVADTNGIVTLTWKPNKEADIYGYRVFKANYLNHEFSQITVGACKDTIFYDTIPLNNLNNSIYYKLVALDFHYNPSTFSDPIEVVKPDTIAPAFPLFLSYNSNQYGVQLNWVNSSSLDLAKHTLLRFENNNWQKVKNFTAGETAYFDSLETEETVKYNLIAYDKAGNSTPSHKTITVAKKQTSFVNKKPKFEILKEENKHVLIWEENVPNIKAVVIYKAKNTEPMREYNIIKNTHFLEEKNIAIGETYSYLIKYIYQNGKESVFSDKKIVEW